MSYIEITKRNNTEYASFVKKFSLMGQTFRIKEHIGKNISTVNQKEYLKNNFERVNKKEFDIRKEFLEGLDIVYDDSLLDNVEFKSIEINNLLEIKEIEEPVLIEFAKEFIFNSNNIEGSKIPAKEVKKIIETGDSRYKNRNEIKEVYNSIEAFKYLREGFKFNIASIKRLYYIMTKDLTMNNGEKYPRGFKKVENIVNNQPTISPVEVEKSLIKLLQFYKENKRKIHPFELAFYFHLRYEEIHPFLDANGRTGRLIMNKILMDLGYFPIIIYKDNSKAYFNAISKGLKRETKKTYYQFMIKQSKKTYDTYFSIIKEY